MTSSGVAGADAGGSNSHTDDLVLSVKVLINAFVSGNVVGNIRTAANARRVVDPVKRIAVH